MRIQKPTRDERIAVTLTEKEKMAIAREAEKEKRTVTSYIRYRLRDVLEGANDDRN